MLVHQCPWLGEGWAPAYILTSLNYVCACPVDSVDVVRTVYLICNSFLVWTKTRPFAVSLNSFIFCYVEGILWMAMQYWFWSLVKAVRRPTVYFYFIGSLLWIVVSSAVSHTISSYFINIKYIIYWQWKMIQYVC